METNLNNNISYIVYKTLNLVNNKIYIGIHKTSNPYTFDGYLGCGVYTHNSSTYNNPTTAFQCAVKKYGTKNFKRTVLKICKTKEEALKIEEQLVTKEFITRKDVYNMIIGGINSPTNSIKINQFTLEGNLIKQWESIQEASDSLGISHTAIINAIKLKGSCKKFYWSKELKINTEEYSLNEGTLCYEYDSNGNYLQTYNSIYEAAKQLQELPQTVQRAVKGGFKIKNNFYSDKLYEIFIPPVKTDLKNNPLYVYDLNGNFIIKLCGIKNICEYFRIKSNCVIYNAIRCNRPYKNYQLTLKYKDHLDPITSKRNIPKKVIQYSKEGKIIEVFDSITKACEKFGTGVQKVLRGKQQLCKGFIFKYESL